MLDAKRNAQLFQHWKENRFAIASKTCPAEPGTKSRPPAALLFNEPGNLIRLP
jgi:hypothetical protein